jgi:hypothetical protein
VPVEGWGSAQAHNIATVSVDRIVGESEGNIGPALLRQIREVVAFVVGIE